MKAIDVINTIRSEMKANFIERDTAVDVTILTLIAGVNCFNLGKPGTSKSLMARNLCERITGAKYFEWLLSKQTKPEEIFGPTSFESLKNGKFERVTTAKLPEADIAFLDEVFKANSAINNMLLPAMNERIFHNNGGAKQIPLQSMFAASNEIPDDEDNLGANYDRYMLKLEVNYIEDDGNFASLLRLGKPSQQTTITKKQIEAARQESLKVTVPDGIIHKIIELRNELKANGIIVSDRKWRESIPVVQAWAWMNGHAEVQEDDLAIYQHIVWDKPDQIRQVERIVNKLANPIFEMLQGYLDRAKEFKAQVVNANEADRAQVAPEMNTKFRQLQREIEAEVNAAPAGSVKREKLAETLKKVQDMNGEVVNILLGIGN